MKRAIRMIILLLLVLTACSPAGTGYECSEGICISITYEEQVQATVPAVFKIYVRTDKDVERLGVSLIGHRNISLHDVVSQPEGAKIGYQDDRSIDWTIDTKGGEEYIFNVLIILDKPSDSFGVSGYELFAVASQISGFRVNNSLYIFLDAEGNQMEESEALLLMETDLPLPTLPPDVTVIPDTPFPTIIWPTETSLPTLTPTLPSYP